MAYTSSRDQRSLFVRVRERVNLDAVGDEVERWRQITYPGGELLEVRILLGPFHLPANAVVGAIATMGVIVGADIPMFLGAMIMGPLGGYVIKKFDQWIEGKVKAGFEMLVNNFSAGILGGLLAILAFLAIGPAVDVFKRWESYAADLERDTDLFSCCNHLGEARRRLR